MAKVFASIGECMVELSSAGEGLYRRGFAGDTLNTAWSVRALTSPDDVAVRYVTGLGDDMVSQEMLDFIAAAGIDTGGVIRVPGRTAGLYMITLDGHERSFAYWRDMSAARLLASDPEKLAAVLADVDAIYLSGITLAILSPEHRAHLFYALRACRERGAMVVFDGNIRPRLWPDADATRRGIEAGYRAASVGLPTVSDEKDLFGDASPQACIGRILGYGVPEVVAKDGAQPCLVAFGDAVRSVPAIDVARPVDTTGAGDSFNAGYLAGRLSGLPPVEAAGLGHRVAAKVICAHGALIDHAALRTCLG